MSRIIVKNLPRDSKEEKIRGLFEDCGVITDCRLKYTPQGRFRGFAFIGYRTNEEAEMAIKKHHRTYIKTYKLQVEIAKDFGDTSKPRAWSKYASDSSAHSRIMKSKNKSEDKSEQEEEKSPAKVKEKDKVESILEELEGDADFQEFLNLHNKSGKALWKNDNEMDNSKSSQKKDKLKKGDIPKEEKPKKDNASKEEKPKKDGKQKHQLKDGLSELGYKPKERPWELKNSNEEAESIAETGRLYVRNLPYVCTEDDLAATFGKYGDLTETSMPIDRTSKKPKGFAFITYVLPTQAVKAQAELDGTVFMGRMLHILPGKEKPQTEITSTEHSSYKKKLEKKRKATASHSHNWNTLFLGANAVADAMAGRYSIDKSVILDANQERSLGVRLALGETELIAETRQFLLDNGVALDAFSQADAPRSRTCILVKNLPTATTSGDIEALFSPLGDVVRVVLPPSGITALVQMAEPSEARAAFTKLAYSKYKDMPLYLEWAPLGVMHEGLDGASTSAAASPSKGDKNDKKADNAGAKEDDASSQPGGKGAKVSAKRNRQENKKQTGSKILVRNVPFEAKQQEVRELFSVFGDLKSVRLPKKISGTGTHRGFAFVDFLSKNDAKRAFESLCHSTHLYGRRLVLEWAAAEQSIENLMESTAKHYFSEPAAKKLKKADIRERLKEKP